MYHPETHLSPRLAAAPDAVGGAGGDSALYIVPTASSTPFKAGFPEEQQVSQQEKLTLGRFYS